ncbi:unnamed protein product [Enterobius vermicularis]|uniref:RUN domain-containing protein n=1 Tax=Enterobius vermicularis TaxID=51028 RepID=A0A0N4UYT3_ENTVE|nr:unnamed protein product [Enterobius vermicularis]
MIFDQSSRRALAILPKYAANDILRIRSALNCAFAYWKLEFGFDSYNCAECFQFDENLVVSCLKNLEENACFRHGHGNSSWHLVNPGLAKILLHAAITGGLVEFQMTSGTLNCSADLSSSFIADMFESVFDRYI